VWHQGLGEKANLDLTTFIGSFNAGDLYDGANLTYELRYNHTWWNQGSIYAGGYHAWFGGNSLGQSTGAVANRGNLAGNNILDGNRTDGFYAGINQELYKGIGGFKSMGSIFPKYGWDWEVFWNITAFFSIVLAFMNLLPIPALDGGHVMFTLYEMITRRKPSEKFLEYAQIVGMILLFGLLIYANGNDLFGWGSGR
jgi:hypothetical protein